MLGKYGSEADKLVYKFSDAGDRPIGLRYDQTVPTARVIAANQQSLPFPFYRYQIQPVWRAEKPQQGRFREFLQCDIDIFGTTSPLADAQIIATTLNTFDALGLTQTELLINSRSLLFSIIKQADIPDKLKFSVIQTIDKLDKQPISQIKQELQSKGLSQASITKLFDLIDTIKPNQELLSIIQAAEELGAPADRIRFTPTLARGLDYYTGVIFEVTSPDIKGSLAGGGRYDDLINQLSGIDIPAVGLAFGLDRIIDLMQDQDLFPQQSTNNLTLVTIFNSDLAPLSSRLTATLNQNQIPALLYPQSDHKLQKQLKYADKLNAKFAIIIGDEEAKNQTFTLKDLASGNQSTLPLQQLIDHIKKSLQP